MNRLQGRIYVFTDPKARTVRVIAENHGRSPGTLTHNVFPTKEAAATPALQNGRWVTHDDMRFSHGTPVPDASPDCPTQASIRLPLGQTYRGGRDSRVGQIQESVEIAPGNWVRVGFRRAAW